jgi:hypothetical protein
MRRFRGKALLVLCAVVCFAAGGITDHLARGRAEGATTNDASGDAGRRDVGRAGSRGSTSGPVRHAGSGPAELEAEEATPGPRPGESAAELFERAIASSSPSERQELLYQVRQMLRPEDVTDALTWVERIPSTTDRLLFTEDLLVKLAERDPEDAIARSMDLMRGIRRSDLVAQVVRTWHEREPERATEWVLAQPAGATRDRAIGAVVARVMEDDPGRAIEIASRMSPGAMPDMMFDIYSSWATRDPAAAAAGAAQIQSAAARRNAVQSVAYRWAEQAPEDALAWATSLPNAGERESATDSILRTAVQRDPVAALRLAIRTGGVSSLTFGQIAGDVAREDAESALALCETLPAGPRREQALAGIAHTLSETDPDSAMRLASGLESADERALVYGDIAYTLAAEDPEAAATWAAGLPDESGSPRAMTMAVSSWARTDPRAAASFVESLPAGEARIEAERALVDDWADSDPARAGRWMLEHGQDQQENLDRFLDRWAYSDEDQAARWVSSLAPGGARDSALGAMGLAVVRSDDPASAWDYVERIQDEEVRDERRQSVAELWLSLEPEEARAFLEGADISEELRQRILDPDAESACACPSLADLAEEGDYDEVEEDVEEEPEEV